VQFVEWESGCQVCLASVEQLLLLLLVDGPKETDADACARSVAPQRILLQTKLTKRCPHPNCRHLLIQPDTKSTRMKIKMVAGNYLPALEVGRKRRVPVDGGPGRTVEEMDIRRKERRRLRSLQEEDEGMDVPLQIGEVVSTA
jgi:dynactin-4